jgi:hypothetical protein
MKHIAYCLLFFGFFCFGTDINQTLKEIEMDEQSCQEVQEVLRKMDDDLKEGFAHFAGLLNGIAQIVDGKQSQERMTLVNGINQFIGSLVDILLIGQKRNGLHAIDNREELRRLLIWAMQMLQKQRGWTS